MNINEPTWNIVNDPIGRHSAWLMTPAVWVILITCYHAVDSIELQVHESVITSIHNIQHG